MLKRGGSAVDAAIAVQAMLSLVEPQSSGLGGGAFMTYYDGADRQGHRLRRPRGRAGAGDVDACSCAPTARRCRSTTAVVSGRATGVPGAVQDARPSRMASTASCRGAACSAMPSGRRDEGFIVSPRLARLIHARLCREPRAGRGRLLLASRTDALLNAGDRLRNPAYADFLRRLAGAGPGGALCRIDRGEDRRNGLAPGRSAGR